MSTHQWHYTANGTRHGPVSDADFRAQLAAGRIPPDSFVWHEGLAQWTPLAQVPGLVTPAVSYFNPAAGMPPRAAETLRGHARPTGDTGDWPLDDARLQQFAAALKLRKRIVNAANLYRSLLALSAIGGAIVLIVAFAAFAVPGSGRGATAAALPAIISGGVIVAFAVLYWLAWRATLRSHRWAPLTLLIIYFVFIALNVLSIGLTAIRATGNGDAIAAAIGGVIGIGLMAAFAIVSWRAYTAIPPYLACPAWCQELLVKAGL